VYFSSEQIQLEIVMVNNQGTEPVRLLVGGKTLAASFAAKRPDGTDFEFHLSNEVIRRVASSETPVDIGSEFTLSPEESLILKADVPAGHLTQGEHVVLFTTSIRDSGGLPLAPQASQRIFEVRPSNDASAMEEARRNATRAFLAGEFAAAETWIETLLRLHPRSYAAYAMRGQIAEQAGDRVRAQAAYQQAIHLLQSRSDEHFLRRYGAGGYLMDDLISAFQQRIQANQDASKK
jgi:hypothetical protein